MTRHATTALIPAALACPAFAQVPIDPDHAFAWSENTGWFGFAGAPAPDDIVVSATFLTGFVWGENVGWINLGNGAGPYANTGDTDFGVNIFPGGDLGGLAWGENVGWINFGTAPTLGAFAQQARYDATARRFRGYAWGENIGWINLDDVSSYVGTLGAPCPADLAPPMGLLDLADIVAFVTAFTSMQPQADLYPDTLFDLADVVAFVTAFQAGCP
ncbi:MAG: hypothetical protein H6810_05305 [Phycisphaeraceae bacterium]|nr:MAG: hypothetical protein H6810_05305 [Phycisphaeraceae bacterium]